MSTIATTAALPSIAAAPAFATNNSDARLIQLGSQFLQLSAEYDAMERKVDHEGLSDRELTAKGQLVQDVEREIKRTPAHTIEGLLAKASVIRYWARREIQEFDDELSAQSVALDLAESLFKISASPSIAAT